MTMKIVSFRHHRRRRRRRRCDTTDEGDHVPTIPTHELLLVSRNRHRSVGPDEKVSSSRLPPAPYLVSDEVARQWVSMTAVRADDMKHARLGVTTMAPSDVTSTNTSTSTTTSTSMGSTTRGGVGQTRKKRGRMTRLHRGKTTTRCESTQSSRSTNRKKFISFGSRHEQQEVGQTCCSSIARLFFTASLIAESKSSLRRCQKALSPSQPPPPPPPLLYSNTFCKRKKLVYFGVMSDWKSAIDPKSGKTYYFNAVTRETQWRKPIELASPEERHQMEAKERKQKEFFAAMEANILSNLNGNAPTPKPKLPKRKKSAAVRPTMVKTISSMDEKLLTNLVKRVPSHRNLSANIERAGDKSLYDFGRSSASRNIMEGSGTDLGGRMHGQRNVLEDIEEASGEFVYNGAFSSMDEASDNLGLSLEESQALQELAKNCQAMIQASDEKDSTENLMCSFGGEDSLDLSLSDLHFSDEEDNNQQSERTMDSLDFSKNSISADEPPTPVDAKPPLTKRSTCGTMYVGTTMSAPDKDATIRCVCGVFRAHILSSETEEGPTYDPITDQFRLFNDRESQRSATPAITEDDEEEELNLDELIVGHDEKNVPDLDEITFFYRDVFTKAQMESDCIIMSLVYVERLIKMTSGLLRPRRSNWRSLLFSCMILSSKVWDDLSMWNADFSHTCPAGVHFTLKRINELELAILKALRYRVKVPASEYAKYYFLLRSMLIKSGLGEGTMGLSPLDVEGAKKLQTVSRGYQTNGLAKAENRARKKESLRSKSMGSADRAKLTAALEQVVNF